MSNSIVKFRQCTIFLKQKTLKLCAKRFCYLYCRKIQVTESDIRHLQSLNDTALGYLTCQPFLTVTTDYGPQNGGSVLAHQVRL